MLDIRQSSNHLPRYHIISVADLGGTTTVQAHDAEFTKGCLSTKLGKIASDGLPWRLMQCVKFLPVDLFVHALHSH